MMIEYTLLDRFIKEIDTVVRTVLPPTHRSVSRSSPANKEIEASLNPAEKKHTAGLMRVNHAGEVCAQALYQGQALTAALTATRMQMQEAAAEETDHLGWCEARLQELNSAPSAFNMLWYMGSFLLGAVAGLAGDQYSLGFVAETEHQVSAHLQRHMQAIPQQDKKTRAILQQMQEDEAAHAYAAIQAGGIELPTLIKKSMSCTAKLMTTLSYYF